MTSQNQSSDRHTVQVPNKLPEDLDCLGLNDEGSLDGNILMNHLQELYKCWMKRSSSFLMAEVAKSNTDSIKLRESGNQKFIKENNDFEALNFYTRSVAAACEGSEELSLAYGNRSAVLFYLHEWIPCLLDTNRALNGNCPTSLKAKVLDRKKKCLIQIKNISKNCKEAKQIKGHETNPVKKINHVEDIQWRKLCKFGNPLLPNTSSKVQLACNDQYGRFFIATRDIEPGEILSSQPYFASIIEPEAQYSYCSHCFMECFALISCSSCTKMYCSEDCRKEAYHLYHRIECRLLSFEVIRDSVGYDALALRMFLIGTAQGAQLKNLMKDLPLQNIFQEKTDPTNKPFVNDYLSALKMCRTLEGKIWKDPAWFAMETMVLLRQLGFFDCNSSMDLEADLNEAELFTVMCLMNNSITARYNRFAIGQRGWHLKPDNYKPVGNGICILHNFLNHSCDRNTSLFMRNKEQVLFALRPIAKGEQVFTSYCPTYAYNPIEDRTKFWAFASFICQCEACVNNWPLHETLLQEISNSEARVSKLEFLVNNKKAAIEELKKTVWSVLQKRKLRSEELIPFTCKYIRWIFTNIKNPSISHIESEYFLDHVMVLLYDDFHRGKYMSAFETSGGVETWFKGGVDHILKSYDASCSN